MDAVSRDAVRDAMREVRRERFLRRADRRRAGYDGPLGIGHDQTSSQPRTVADMLRLLDVQTGHRVLDVGAGSGWTTALLAHLVGPSGSVCGVEIVPELAAWGARNLSRSGHAWATLVEALPGLLGLPDQAPYDRILVSAEPPDLPDELVEQLDSEGGVLVIPVAGEMLRVVRTGEERRVTRHGRYRFVPLVAPGA